MLPVAVTPTDVRGHVTEMYFNEHTCHMLHVLLLGLLHIDQLHCCNHYCRLRMHILSHSLPLPWVRNAIGECVNLVSASG